MVNSEAPGRIFSGYWDGGHCQGIAVDKAGGVVYYSFTTKLVKTDFSGRLLGTVEGLIGHLGCIDFCETDGRVYGSLEFKNDAIGRGILRRLGKSETPPDAFYCAIFDGDAITRPGMDAERDGVMRAVFLPDVAEAYAAEVQTKNGTVPHRWGCSGIDGTGWGRLPGEAAQTLVIAAGVYADLTRDDNDYQVLFCYRNALSWWDTRAKPLNQAAMHRSGARADGTLFLFTGNTEYGVQNLEYDAFTGDWYLAVYPGHKPQFPDYSLYVMDGSHPAAPGVHTGTGERITEVFLKGSALPHGIAGSRYPYGATGMYAFGDGRWYVSVDGNDPARGQYTELKLITGDALTG